MSKDFAVSTLKSGISLIPWAGGVINEVISYYQGKYVDDRITKLEKLLDANQKETFTKNINSLTEEEYFLTRKIIKFYLLEAEPNVSDAIVKFIIDYILNNKRNNMGYLIKTLCELDSSDITLLKKIKYDISPNERGVYCWNDISPYETISNGDKKGKIKLSSLMVTQFKTNEYENNLEYNMIGFSFKKLENLDIIVSSFLIYPGENNIRNVEHFCISQLGKEILKYI